MQEMWTAPSLNGFVNIRASSVNQFAQVFEDGSGKIGRARNIFVHAAISFYWFQHYLYDRRS